MSVKFVLGGSGSGKSEYLYSKVTEEASCNPKKNYLVIVPEQFTLATQQKLVSLSPKRAIMNVDILSFKRLAYRVFDDLGMSDVSVLDETGKNLLIRKIAQEQDEKLTVLHSNMSRMGYVEQLKSLISEFSQYNVTPDALRKLEEDDRYSRSFIAKIKDVSLLYEFFLEAMKGKYVMAEEILHVLARVAPESELLKDSVLVFDEFTGFTPIQYDLMRALMPVVDSIYVALSIDAKQAYIPSSGVEDLFDMSKSTIERMSKIASEINVDVEFDKLFDSTKEGRFKEAPALFHLEQNLFRPYFAKYNEIPEEIHLHNMTSPQEEVIYVAREINRLIRSQKYRYREIAVVTGDLPNYSIQITEIFEKYGIPYFLDSTREISFSAFIECIRAMLEVIDTRFSYDSIMRFLRTGFCDIETEKIDLLDNYLIATGTNRITQWQRTWLGRKGKLKEADLQLMEELRLEILQIFKPLLSLMKKKDAVNSDAIAAVYEIITSMNCFQKLQALSKTYEEMDMLVKAKEFDQVYNKVMQIFEKYEELLGEEAFEIGGFIELFEAALEAVDVSATPPGFDSVVVGDIERTRLNGPSVMFFVGINEGIIPKSATTGGIISEYERQAMLENGLEIAPGLREKAFIQRFYLYRNLTKPSKQLYLSYARSGNDGKALQASYLIKTLIRMFPEMQDEMLDDIALTPDFSTKAVALEYLAHGEHSEDWFACASALGEEDTIADIIAAPYYSYEEAAISKNIAEKLYGDVLFGSVSRIETFSKCQFMHFVSYGLRLSKRVEAGLDYFDIGNIYHSALEYVGRNLTLEDSWNLVSEQRRDELSDEAIDFAINELGHTEFIESYGAQKYYLNRMKGMFRNNVRVLVTQVASGEFKPTDFELHFGEKKNQEFVFSLKDNHFLNFRGMIDRIDTLKKDGKLFVKIIDYKTYEKNLRISDIYHGLQLQLAAYMNIAMRLYKEQSPETEVVPAALFYQQISDDVLSKEGFEEYLGKHKPKGRVLNDMENIIALDKSLENGGKSNVSPVNTCYSKEIKDLLVPYATAPVISEDQFALLENYAIEYMRDSGDKIYEGAVSVNPFEKSCEYCDYKGLCGFDRKVGGYKYRKPVGLPDEELLEQMEKDIALMKYSRGEE